MSLDQQTDDNALSERINRIINARYETDKDTLDALEELSTVYKGNTPIIARNLRSDIELQSIETKDQFLESFGKIKHSFDAIHANIESMDTSVKDMAHRLQRIKLENKSLIDATKDLERKNQQIQMQKQIVDKLVNAYQLTTDEKAFIQDTSDVTPEILNILDKVQRVQNERCRVLIDAGCHNLASDIMQQMNLYYESLIDRLYRWTQKNCRNIDACVNEEFILDAMQRLNERPVLFKNIMDEYCSARRSTFVRRFIDVLTIGANNHAAMELHAHDPQRYVGDMLRWLNDEIHNEQTYLTLLLKKCEKIDVSLYVDKSLVNITEGVVHPLKSRIEKIITVPSPPTTLYTVTNLIRFYTRSIQKTVKDGLLMSTFADMQDVSERAFLGALQSQVLAALTRLESPPRDLSPTPAISHMLVVLQEILSMASMLDEQASDARKIVTCVIDPLLHAVNEQASKLATCDMAAYLLNCVRAMEVTLMRCNYTQDRLERLRAIGDAQVDTLTSEQASSAVVRLNLGTIYTILQGCYDGPLASVAGMEPANLRGFLDKLDMFVDVPDLLLMPQVCLLSNEHKQLVKTRAFDVIVSVYKKLYEAVNDPKNNYPPGLIVLEPEQLAEKFGIR